MGDAGIVDGYIFRINQIDWGIAAGVAVQAGCRIDIERSPDYQHNVRGGHDVYRFLNLRHRLSEKHDVRAELIAIGRLVAQIHLLVAYVEHLRFGVGLVIDADLRADLRRLAVKVHDLRGAGSFVQIVNVLRDDSHFVVLLQSGNREMRGVRLGLRELLAQTVVESEHQRAVPVPPFDRRNFLRIILSPETVVASERAETALGTHARARQHGNFPFTHSNNFFKDTKRPVTFPELFRLYCGIRRKMTREESITFYKAHAQRLYNISLRIVRDSAQAEEIMQDTILKFLTSEIRTADERQTNVWLTRVCIRRSIDALRKRKREKLFIEEYTANSESSTDESLPESGITLAAVRKAIDSLPESSKLILNLVLVEGLDYEEIAEVTGEREGTLRTQFSRAKARLAKILKK